MRKPLATITSVKGKPLDEYKGFSYRLVKVAIEKGIEDTRELADALYENAECKKAITIRKTQKKIYKEVSKIREDKAGAGF